jgi:hypothetical protein
LGTRKRGELYCHLEGLYIISTLQLEVSTVSWSFCLPRFLATNFEFGS